MKIKPNASLRGIDIVMRPVLVAVDEIWSTMGQEAVVTSGTEDSEHSAGSLHYYGLALDFRTRYFSDAEKRVAWSRLKESLPKPFDVILESTHIHVEYDKINNG